MMSNVQLSSSALETLVARRTFPLHARTAACRNLFGPVDHDELNLEMKSKLREISERDQQRWNFNFEGNIPMPGDYQWEECAEDKTPNFYRDSIQVGKIRMVVTPVMGVNPDSGAQASPTQDIVSVCEDRLSSLESSTSSPAEVNQENSAVKLNSGKHTRRQALCLRRRRDTTTDNNTTHITDFFVKRKKSTETKSNDSTCQLSSASNPLEQTPRKRIR
ncbi:cyclin-dependent kinase inhibitor 1C [Aplochiton taeniatus]